ncbi:methyltransf_25 domain-containing protein [Caerostris extrusa]|uniref:Methyltransf_25 domain-containing protein n=1 Tax=Caerostris extrusa TaxID=172846 RepID=A0AAV4XES3_CAEEX|nr:methyltransf_25 domain-containing protein [Caerostris extrusa]
MIAEEYNVRYILLLKLKSYPQWKDLSGEVVMDIGCGDGSESTKCILQLFPRVEKILAIDKHRRVIAAAKRENAHPKIEYHAANIAKILCPKKLTLMTWYNKISKIISFHCFEFVKLKAAFQNVFFLLKPGGEGVIVLMTSNAFRDAYDEMLGNRMWSRHLKNRKGPSAGFANYVTHFECAALAQEVGLNVRFCQARENTACFQNDQEIKGMFPRHCLVSMFPRHLFGVYVSKTFVWCLCFQDICLASMFPRHLFGVYVSKTFVWRLCFQDICLASMFPRHLLGVYVSKTFAWRLRFQDICLASTFPRHLLGVYVSKTFAWRLRFQDICLASTFPRHLLGVYVSKTFAWCLCFQDICLVSMFPRHLLGVYVSKTFAWCLCFQDICLVSMFPRHLLGVYVSKTFVWCPVCNIYKNVLQFSVWRGCLSMVYAD